MARIDKLVHFIVSMTRLKIVVVHQAIYQMMNCLDKPSAIKKERKTKSQFARPMNKIQQLYTKNTGNAHKIEVG